jgi:hypothetical protein
MVNYTKRPWKVVEDIFNERPEIRDSGGRRIAVVTKDYPMSEKTRSANARLTSKAPELIETLEEALESWRLGYEIYEDL